MKSFLFSAIAIFTASGAFFVSRNSLAKSAKEPKCIVALELNDLDLNDDNRRALKSALRDLNLQPKEFFIDNKEQLNPGSRSLSAVRLLDYGPRPGINEEAPYVGQKQISLVVPKSTVLPGTPTLFKMVYNIQVYALKNVNWNVTTDADGNKQAHFRGEVEKVSAPVEIGQRLVTLLDKMPPICEALGKSKMDLIDPRICSLQKVEEPVTDESVMQKKIRDYLKTCD